MWSDSFQVSLVKLIFILQTTWNFDNCNEKGLWELETNIAVRGAIKLFHLEKGKQRSIYKITLVRCGVVWCGLVWSGLVKVLWDEISRKMGNPNPDNGSRFISKSRLHSRAEFSYLSEENKSSSPGYLTGPWWDSGEIIDKEASWSVKKC